MSRDEFYSGCYGRASINFYAFNVSSKGIAAGLNNLQKLEDGEMLAGGSTAEEDFGGDNAIQDDDSSLMVKPQSAIGLCACYVGSSPAYTPIIIHK